LRTAVVPFNCAVPTMDEFWHSPGNDVSQKVIVPVVTGAPPLTTEAVKVTAPGDATVDEESTSVVVVETAAACAAYGSATANRADRNSLKPGCWLQAEGARKFHIQDSSVRTYG
jgi:hypothetical protein